MNKKNTLIPERLREGAWHGHIVFAQWLINLLNPNIFVELGTYLGDSYFAFCQSVKNNNLKTKCYAIDSWLGEQHAGFYGEEFYNDVSAYNLREFNNFSTLYRCFFDEAIERFKDSSIDLLHIDGFHTYDAVSHDFYAWFKKLSPHAIVLFHDTSETQSDFGVWKFWDEICEKYPKTNFNFIHSHGLGVLGIGQDYPNSLIELFKAKEKTVTRYREYFSKLNEYIIRPALTMLPYSQPFNIKLYVDSGKGFSEREIEVIQCEKLEDSIKLYLESYDEIIRLRLDIGKFPILVKLLNVVLVDKYEKEFKVNEIKGNYSEIIASPINGETFFIGDVYVFNKPNPQFLLSFEKKSYSLIKFDFSILGFSDMAYFSYINELKKQNEKRKEMIDQLESKYKNEFEKISLENENLLKSLYEKDKLITHKDQEILDLRKNIGNHLRSLMMYERKIMLKRYRLFTLFRIVKRFFGFFFHPQGSLRYLKEKRTIKKSGFFDNQYYLANNPDLTLTYADLLRHFILYGWRENRNPGPNFNVRFYLSQYPDVKRAMINPLVHYIKCGREEGRHPVPQYQQPVENQLPIKQKQPLPGNKVKPITPQQTRDDLLFDQPFKIAICLHIFYSNHVCEILKLLNNIKFNYDLFITISGSKNKELFDKMTQSNINIHIEYVQNLGMDIKPFLDLLPLLKERKYNLVLKLHTKKDHPDFGTAWRDIMLNSLLGSPKSINKIISTFQNNSQIKMIGSQSLYKSARRFMYQNEVFVSQLIKIMSGKKAHKEFDWGFFAGSMFWAKIEIFDPLIHALSNTSFNFTIGTTAGDGTLSHGVERIFGYLPYLIGGKIATISYPEDSVNLNNPIIQLNSTFTFEPATVTIKNNNYSSVLSTCHPLNNKYKNAQIPLVSVLKEENEATESNLFLTKKPYIFLEPKVYKNLIANYNLSKIIDSSLSISKRRIVIFTAISGRYDFLQIHEFVDSNFSYIIFSDTYIPDTGLYKVLPIEYTHPDTTRSALFIKTHPHLLLSDYDIAIWIDANIIIKADLYPIIEEFIASGKPIGAIHHPFHSSVYEEADMCIKNGIDDISIINQQMDRYRQLNFDGGNLIESNVMMFNLTKKSLGPVLNSWWSEIERGSKQDQLSLNFAIKNAGIEWHPIWDKGYSIGNHPSFTIIQHDSCSGGTSELMSSFKKPPCDPYEGYPFSQIKNDRINQQFGQDIDIVICIHNALSDVCACLESIERSKSYAHIRLILIDDGSDDKTRDFLEEYTKNHNDVMLHRNDQAAGYTYAANMGLKLSSSEFIILLNSDTIVTDYWADKLANAVNSRPSAGIVGPMSNAAGYQSIPDHSNTNNQRVFNKLPPGITIEDMNIYCEEWTISNFLPYVPLVHRFCFGITREVINKIGLFNETEFSKGYVAEYDYCFRACNAGFLLLVATHTYVYQQKSESYGNFNDRVALINAGMKALKKLYGSKRIQQSIDMMEENLFLNRIRKKAYDLYRLSNEVKRILIFSHYNPHNDLSEHVLYTLKKMNSLFERIVFVSNSILNETHRQRLIPLCNKIMERENTGFDFGAWKDAISEETWDVLGKFDSLVLMNDTCFGPIFNIRHVFCKMEESEVDFWGLTNHKKTKKGMPGQIEMPIPEHIQSYFMVFHNTAIKTTIFKEFWNNLKYYTDRYLLIQNCETKLTKILLNGGLKYKVFVDTLKDDYPIADLTKYIDIMIQRHDPLIKIKRFLNFSHPKLIQKMISQVSKYPLHLLEKHINKTYTPNVSLKIYNKSFISLDNVIQTAHNFKVAIHFHIFYIDILKKYILILREKKLNCDLYITTDTETKGIEIKELLCQYNLLPMLKKLKIQKNNGRDLLPWLCIAKDLEKYDLVGHFHTSKISTNYDWVGASWQDEIISLLFNPIISIIELFHDNNDIGIVVPEIPFYFKYFYQQKAFDGLSGINRENCLLLWKRMKNMKKIIFSELKTLIMPYGNMFWYRPNALKPLFDLNLTEKDFPPETLPNDGTIADAIERLPVYIAWSQNYDYRIAISKEFIDNGFVYKELINKEH